MEKITVSSLRHGFRVLKVEDLPEIEGCAYMMLHEQSGARLLYLKNDDANKAFSISFKTPASDDTGVFHILEHSVLCGSRKFPVKEPFVNLLKTSMQTFLNAMTFPDKTMYPVASTNEQDLMNLMDVYLDAVFFPAIYQKEAIFQQEGWHLETQASDDGDAAAPSLMYNGVVFNEMKGALSEPDSVLYDTLSAALFPETTYRFESGGTPQGIPTLTYEGFLDTHRRHYRPDNSYIMLYGDLDVDRFLSFIDEEYLTPLASASGTPLDINPLGIQKPVAPALARKTMVTAPENACAAFGCVIGSMRDRERVMAADILLDAIMGSNEAPLKRALLDAGLAADASAYLADAIVQPFAVVQLRGLKEGAAEKLRPLIEREVARLADGALDRKLVEAALSHAEFVMRERNFGYPDGIVFAMSSMAGWLYDDDMAVSYLRYEKEFANLRAKIDEGYFERLLRELFLENDHVAEAEVVPVDRVDDAQADALAALGEGFCAEDFARIDAQVEALRAAQEAPDAPEDVAKLPQLGVDDIGQAPHEGPLSFEKGEKGRPDLLLHDIPTHGIAYAYRYFDLTRIEFEDIPYATVLSMVLGKLATAHHSAAEIDVLAQSILGNLSFFMEVHEHVHDRTIMAPKFVMSSSALSENVDAAARLSHEILTETDFTDYGKILDILKQKRVGIEQACAAAGHSVAMARVASYCLPAGVLRQQIGGIDFYGFLRRLIDEFDERKERLSEKLANMARRLFTDEGTVVSFAGSSEDLERMSLAFGQLGPAISESDQLKVPEPRNLREAFVVPTDVTFTAVGYDRRLLGSHYTGAWLLASRVLSYDYLWNEVRVKGGAYGAGFQAIRSGSMRFYSFRDPHVAETVERFTEAGEWLSAFDPTPSEMAGFVVSTVAGVDAPLKPRELLRRQDGMFFARYTPEERARVRDQIVRATPADVRELGSFVSQAASQDMVCVVGNRDIIERSGMNLKIIDLLGEDYS